MRSQKEKGEPLVMIGVTDERAGRAWRGPSRDSLLFERRRDLDDYIHLTASLGELKGKDFHGKRGHVKKFSMLYNYEYRPMTPELVPAVLEMNTAWCRGHSYDDDDAARHEKLAAELLLRNFEALHVEGGVLLVDGRVVAASAGTPQFSGSDTIVVHFEKGLTEYEGIYWADLPLLHEGLQQPVYLRQPRGGHGHPRAAQVQAVVLSRADSDKV